MTLFLRFFFVIFSIWISSCKIFAVSATQPQNIEKKSEKLLLEVQELKKSLTNFQKRLSGVIDQLAPIKETFGQSTLTPATNLFALESLNKISQFFKKRGQEFFSGIMDVTRTVMQPINDRIAPDTYFLGFALSFSIGVISVLIGRFFLKSRIINFQKKAKSRSLTQFAFITSLIMLPLIGYFLLSLIAKYLLQYYEICNNPSQSAYCAFLPFNMYILWAGLYWVRIMFSPARPSQAILPVDPYGSHHGAFWMRLALIIYFLGAILLTCAEIFLMPYTVIHSLSDMVGLFIGISLLKGLFILHSHLVPSAHTNIVLRSISFVRWAVLGVCAIWILDRQFLNRFLTPILITIFGLLMVNPFEHLCRRLRLRFLWNARHRSAFWKRLLKSQNIFNVIIRYSVYSVILLTWVSYLWNDDPSIIAVVITWFKTLLPSPIMQRFFNCALVIAVAIFLVKSGERVLKYYVEDKYATDSAENNFLASRLKTLMAMLKTALRIVVWIPTISIIFITQFDSINITAWITSIGAASFGLTFGFQSIVRDFITGFFIILENNLMVGDEVDIDNRSGKVEKISLRTLKIRADNGTLLTIPFGIITIIGNKNRHFCAVLLNISVGYREDLDRVQSIIERAFTLLKKTPIAGRRVLGSLEIRGIVEVTSYSVVIQAKIKTSPNAQDFVRRTFNRHLKQLFDDAGIIIPSPPYTVLQASPSMTSTVVSKSFS